MTPAVRLFLFVLIFLCGFALMGFEMLGSRYLNPWFGGGITKIDAVYAPSAKNAAMPMLNRPV